METLEVDGSFGEGGGQILRTAIALSIVTGEAVHVTNIRAGREVAGMRPQHVAAVRILRDISHARLEGAGVGSTEVTFVPDEVKQQVMDVDLGTAASITLVLQAVVPAVSLSGSSLRLDLRGGTDVPWSPSFDYFSSVVREAFGRAGIGFSVAASRRGYYPRGGGRVTAFVEPCTGVKAIRMVNPPAAHPVSITSRCGELPRHVAERQGLAASRALQMKGMKVGDVTATVEQSDSPGSSILLKDVNEDSILGSDSLGARGKRAEEVGAEAAKDFVTLRASGSCLDTFIVDMLAPILCFAGEESRIRIPRVTKHLTTSLHVASLFTSCEYSFDESNGSTLLTIRPTGSPG